MPRPALLLLSAFLLGCGCTPTCVLYATRIEPVTISDVPRDIMEAFRRACPDAKLVSVSKRTSVYKSTRSSSYWAFRFEQDGKLQDDLFSDAQEKHNVYDVQN